MKPTSVYFAECVGPGDVPLGALKVGCSAAVAVRMGQLSKGQPYKCNLLAACPGGFIDEAVLHEWLRADAISGEFFRDTAEARRLIVSMRETSSMPLHVEGAAPRLYQIGQAGVRRFMAMHYLSETEASALTTRPVVFFKAGLAQTTPPRGLVAALAVAALRKGRSVNWDFDFLADTLDQRVAAA